MSKQDISKLIQEELPKAFADGRLRKDRDFSIRQLSKILKVPADILRYAIKKDFGSTKDFFKFLGLDKESVCAARLKNILKKYPNGTPLETSDDKDEKSDALWVRTLRYAKKGKVNRNWYPILDEISNELGFSGYFDFKGKELKTIEQWVDIAENLEEEYGVLPTPKWLSSNGYSYIPELIRKHKDKFKHIKQEKLLKNSSDWLKIAENLTSEYGSLPSPSWLRKNGYSGLLHAKRANPKMFSHLKQNTRKRKINDIVRIAEEISEKHNGLPGYRWLTDNGYGFVYQAKRRNPKKFKHIKEKGFVVRRCAKCDEYGNKVIVYKNIEEAAKNIGVKKDTLASAISGFRKCRGYYWEYVDK